MSIVPTGLPTGTTIGLRSTRRPGIVITRDARPVAKLVRIAERPKPRKRFDPAMQREVAAQSRWRQGLALGRSGRSEGLRGSTRGAPVAVIYLVTSCLLKLLLDEPESEAVRRAVARESEVIISALTELEATVPLRAGWLAGECRERRYEAYARQLSAFRETDPFRFRPLAGSLFQTALRQDREGTADPLPIP
jgi:uncharacterized protein with PIN domain